MSLTLDKFDENELDNNNISPSSNPESSKGIKTIMALGVATLISFLGTMMTDFALGQWVFNETKSATFYGLIGFAALVPRFALAPFIGVLLDRYSRGILMIIGHAGAGICSLLLLYLYLNEILEIWMILLLVGTSSFFNGIVMQSFTVLVPAIIDKENLTRAQGFIGGGFGIIEVIVPAIAAGSIVFFGMSGVFLFDIVSFVTAIFLISIVLRRLNQSDGRSLDEVKDSAINQLLFGFRYLYNNKRLFSYLIFMTSIYFCGGAIFALYTPLILSISDVIGLGTVSTVVGIGSLLGSIFLGLWKGPSNKLVMIYSGLFSMAILMIATTGVFLVAEYTLILLAAIFLLHAASFVIVRGCDVVIWQTLIPKDIQGRVLGVQNSILYAATPIAFLVAGPLVDKVFEPALTEGGALASTVGKVIGVGPGHGIVFFYGILGSFILLSLLVFIKKNGGQPLVSTTTK